MVAYNTNKFTLKRSKLSLLMNHLRTTFKILLVSIYLLGNQMAQGAIIGQMPAHGDILYITAQPCTSETGRIEPNWFFSYSVSATGSVSRSCYVRYNDQIWIRGPFGAETTYPMSYFSKPAGAAENKPDTVPEVKP
jgi:hypothetical protein